MTSPTQRVSLPDSRIQHDEHITMSRSPKNDAENTDSWPTAGESGCSQTRLLYVADHVPDQTSKANSEDSSSTVISFDNVRQPLKRKRRVLTETERQEAAVMRRLGSCDACKRRKVRVGGYYGNVQIMEEIMLTKNLVRPKPCSQQRPSTIARCVE